MKKRYMLILALVLLTTGLKTHAQEYYTARDLVDEATTEAKANFAADAYLVNVFFGRISVGVFTFQMQKDGPDAGKANGWVYHFYSPSLNDNEFFVGIKLLGNPSFITPPDGSVPPLPFEPDAELTNPWVDSPGALGGAKQGGAGQYLTQNPDAEILTAVALFNPAPTQIAPQGKFWVLQFGSAVDTLTCGVYAEDGSPYQCGILTSVKGIPEADGYRLDQSYPNPFSISGGKSAAIGYAIAERQFVRLTLYNALGRELATLHQGMQSPGEYRMQLSPGMVAVPGVYFYRLETARGSDVRRMVVVK